MRRLLALSLVSVVASGAVGAGLVACAADTDEAGLNPQPLPPDDKKENDPTTGLGDDNDRGASSSGGSSGAATESPAPKAPDGGDGG